MASINLIAVEGPRPNFDRIDEIENLLETQIFKSKRKLHERSLDQDDSSDGTRVATRRVTRSSSSNFTFLYTPSSPVETPSMGPSIFRPASASMIESSSSSSVSLEPSASTSSSSTVATGIHKESIFSRGDNRNRKRVESLLREIEWLENYLKGSNTRHSRNPVHYVTSSQLGNQRIQSLRFEKTYGTQHLVKNHLMRETKFDLGSHNKVFCSQWLNDSQVVMGTKCNDILIVDVKTGKLDKIPSLKTSGKYKLKINAESPPCGIHAVEINPSRTLLATGAVNTNEVAIYKLPELDPICVGEAGHTDWIFDLKWMDDEFLITGSRDSTIALWRVDQDLTKSSPDKTPTDCEVFIEPLQTKECKDGQKIRATVFNSMRQEIVALTLNSKLHVFDAQTLEQKISKDLPPAQENVCLAQDINRNLYGVGSKSFVTLVDSRDMLYKHKIQSICSHSGIRSLNFISDLLTIGTGHGLILFYDLRNMKYILDDGNDSNSKCFLTSSSGYVDYDENFNEAFHSNMNYSPAIYTHCFDTSATKIFAAGGPLPASVSGNYAGLWS